MEEYIDTTPVEIQQQRSIRVEDPLITQLLENSGCQKQEEFTCTEITFTQPEGELVKLEIQDDKATLFRMQAGEDSLDIVKQRQVDGQKTKDAFEEHYGIQREITKHVTRLKKDELTIDICEVPEKGTFVVVTGPEVNEKTLKELGL